MGTGVARASLPTVRDRAAVVSHAPITPDRGRPLVVDLDGLRIALVSGGREHERTAGRG